MAKNSYPKGSVGNSYTSKEYESMMENGTWKGGFVKTKEGKFEYYRKNLYEDASGCGCGSDDELGGSGSDEGSGSNVKPLNGSGSVGSCCWSSEISSVNDLGNDCVYKCLEVFASRYKLNITSEAFRYDYLTANMGREGWCGTNDVNQYLGGPYTYEQNKETKEYECNKHLWRYLQCYFQSEGESWLTDIEDVRNSIDVDNQVEERDWFMAFYKTNNTNEKKDIKAHAVIIRGNNKGLLYMQDPSNDRYISQGDASEFKDSNFLYAVRIKGIK